MTTAEVLTPRGNGAIAVIHVRGPQAWATLRKLFIPFGPPLTDAPLAGFRFGKMADDEVILSHVGGDEFEVHCHGGRRVVDWIMDHLLAEGLDRRTSPAAGFVDPGPESLIRYAATLRTASIILDKIADRDDGRYEALGRHLTQPWQVALVGPPNAGKSTLFNALVGYRRSIVSPIAGTTRDLLRATVAFDGWPVELIDTAGLRDAADAIESAGVDRAKRMARDADLCVWLIDAADPDEPRSINPRELRVVNKSDLAVVADFPEAIRVSAATGLGLPELMEAIVAALLPPAIRKPGH